MKKNRNSVLLAAATLLALALPGCSKQEQAPAPAPAKPPQQQKTAPAPATGVQTQLSSARGPSADLNFQRRTDPFKPFAQAVAPAAAQPKGEAPVARPAADLLPIQSFEASRFKVAGIIAGLKENRALILDPNGKGYVVQPGMQVGSNNGRISRITASSVEIVESFKDEKGKQKKRTIVLTLAKKR